MTKGDQDTLQKFVVDFRTEFEQMSDRTNIFAPRSCNRYD